MNKGKVEVFVARLLKLRVHPQPAVDSNDVPFLDPILDVRGKGVPKAADCVMVLFNNALRGSAEGRVDAGRRESKLCDGILIDVACLDVVNHANQSHVVDGFGQAAASCSGA